MAALGQWSGGLLVATEQATQNNTWERWSLEDAPDVTPCHGAEPGRVPMTIAATCVPQI